MIFHDLPVFPLPLRILPTVQQLPRTVFYRVQNIRSVLLIGTCMQKCDIVIVVSAYHCLVLWSINISIMVLVDHDH